MKKIIKILSLSILFFCTNYSYSQELMNYFVEPEEDNTITLQTLVYENRFVVFGSSEIEYVENTINITLCYYDTSFQTITWDTQFFEINLPEGYNNYIININLFADIDGQAPCTLTNLVEAGTLNFDFPYKPTATTYIPDNVFENYLEDLGFGDEIPNNDLGLYVVSNG